jgi:WD40 repeat protein/serine/threonine protein kinase
MAPAERTAYLFEICRENDWARMQAQALLVAYDSAGNFIEKPAVAGLVGVSAFSDEASITDRHIGPYRIMREIGRGGMGVVYLAYRADQEYLKLVAIKLVRPGPNSDEVVRRFRQERQILANLEHPNIAGLLDGGTTKEGWPYVVMEYVVGVPITDYCDEHSLSVTERLELFLRVCAAAAYAHRNLVIHRDLKPGNILVTENGVVKLLDFGIAKLLDQKDQIDPTIFTRTGVHLMTPDYASPEQVRGEAITTATDVYSLGVVLYELLTGHRPYQFKKRSLVEIERVISEQEPERPSVMIGRVTTEPGADGFPIKERTPESVSRTREGKPEKLRGRLAGDLDNVLLMALRKEVAQRYQSVEQLSADIRRHLQGEKVLARQHTIGYRMGKFVRRHRVGVGAAAVLLLTLLAGIATTSWQARKATEQVRVNRRLLYAAQMNLGEQAWQTANIARLRELVESHWPQPGEDDLRGFEWYYLWRLYHHNGEIRTFKHTREVWSVAFSPDGSKLAAGDEDGRLKLWDPVTGQQLAVLSGHERGVWSVAWSPDGRKLATASDDTTAKLWDAATGQALATLKGHTNRVKATAFSSDGRRLATGSDDGTVKVWDTTTGSELTTIQGRAGWIRSLAFSPDGRMLATGFAGGAAKSSLKLWDATTGRELRAFPPLGAVLSIDFSADGKRLAAGTKERSAWVWDANTGEELAIFRGHTSEVRAVAWSRDGRLLATGSADRTLKLWDAATGQELATLKGHLSQVWSIDFSPGGKQLATCSDDYTVKVWDIGIVLEPNIVKSIGFRVVSVAFSPDGRRLAAVGGNTARLWNTITAEEVATLKGHTSVVESIAFSLDGRRIATASQDRTVKLWDAATGQELRVLKGHSDTVYSVKFSPEGQRLITGSSDLTAKLWDATTGQELSTLHGHTAIVYAVAFSPDGRTVATGSFDNTAKLWDAATGFELATLKGHIKVVDSLAFSPDGQTLATGSADNSVKLWQVSTGLEVATLKGHAGKVWSVAFSPDGKRLATGGGEGLVRLWDVQTRQELIALQGHTDEVKAVAFSSDGLTLISGSSDATVRLWRAASRDDVRARDK